MLAYRDLGGELQSGMQYEEKDIEATAQLFRKRAVEQKERASDSKGQEHSVWVVPAPSRAMRTSKIPQYLEESSEEMESGGAGAG